VAVAINGEFRVKVAGGRHADLELGTGSLNVRIYLFDGSRSKNYQVILYSGKITEINHNDWIQYNQNVQYHGRKSNKPVLRIVNKLHYSVAVDVNNEFRVKVSGGRYADLKLARGSFNVRIYLFDGSRSKVYPVKLLNGQITTVNHKNWIQSSQDIFYSKQSP
jgi:hypothetical protein